MQLKQMDIFSPQHSPVVQLNVGGHMYSTSLSTLRKHPDSKLAELFSGQPKLHTDAQGRYFIDRDGCHFRAILEFLRSDWLPTENIQEVCWTFQYIQYNKCYHSVFVHSYITVWLSVFVFFCRSTGRRCTTTSNHSSNVWRKLLIFLENWWGGSSSSPESHTTEKTSRSAALTDEVTTKKLLTEIQYIFRTV